MTDSQRSLRFSIPLPPGVGKTFHSDLEREFNRFALPFKSTKTPVPKLLADLLRDESKRVMRDVKECPPDTLPANLARLDFVMEVCRFAIAHELVAPSDARLSGFQLAHPSTLLDFAAALDITRQRHRAPCIVSPSQDQLNRIEGKLDTLAAWIGGCNER